MKNAHAVIKDYPPAGTDNFPNKLVAGISEDIDDMIELHIYVFPEDAEEYKKIRKIIHLALRSAA